MSWIEKLETPYKITCGDGKSYTPLWSNVSKEIEYNISTFEFKGLAGTLVDRGMPKGTKYNIELYFQGENHLDTAQAFETSAADPNPWVIQHPFYGSLTVQPIGLVFDNSAFNVSKIVGQVIATITEKAPVVALSPEDKIQEDKVTCDDQLTQTYMDDVQPKVADVEEMKKNATTVYKEGQKTLTNTLDAEKYTNAFNNAYGYISNAVAQPLAAIRQLQALINLPAQFADSVKNRINCLLKQMEQLRSSLETILTKSSKKLFENNAGTLVGAVALAAITGVTDDYSNRRQVSDVITLVIGVYNNYLSDLDKLQTLNGGQPQSYIPDAPSIIQLGQLISYTVNSLFQIADNAKQERTLMLEEDSNVILVAQRLYGLLIDDSTLDTLIATNEFGLDDMLELKKGRQILYYV